MVRMAARLLLTMMMLVPMGMLVVVGMFVLGTVFMRVHMSVFMPAAAVAHGFLLRQMKLGLSLCRSRRDVKGLD